MVFGKHINRYYLRYFPLLFVGLLSLLLVDFMQLRIPVLYREIIDGINTGSVVTENGTVPFTMDFVLDEICLPMIFIILSLVVGRFLWRVAFFGSAIRMETDIRRRMFDRAKELSQQYYQVNKVGNLMSLFTNDLETVNDCFGSGILMFFDALLLGVMSLFRMQKMDLSLTLLCLVPLVLLLSLSVIVGKYLTSKWEKRQEAFSGLSDFAQESFSGIAVVKAFVKEARELSAFRRLNRENEDANVAYVKLSALFNILVTFFVGSVMCVILGYGGVLVYRGTFTAGELIEFTGYFNTIIWPVMAISELIDMQSRGKASVKRIEELLDAQADVVDEAEVTEPAPIRGEIEFCNLSFTYPGSENEVLHNVSCHIKAGENIGIIGRTGAGKTTLVDLILRTYNVPRGTVKVDGVDVNDMPIRALRRYAAYVPQDNFLFSDTIEHNIAFAADEFTREDVEAAAELADVRSNVKKFPEGFDTVLGERGVTVSGGQKQRISIARALMKDASILILDDAVSAVDTATERVILDNLKKTRAGKTTILIAHRISTVENMDRILFLDDGWVSAFGTHEELLATCPSYRAMVDLQKLEEQKGDDFHA